MMSDEKKDLSTENIQANKVDEKVETKAVPDQDLDDLSGGLTERHSVYHHKNCL